jgi:hypothetical protein
MAVNVLSVRGARTPEIWAAFVDRYVKLRPIQC